jgi:hypothetical protein
LRSALARFVAKLWNATYRPSALMEGYIDEPLPSLPSVATEMRSSVPASRSRTKTSCWAFVSPGTRLVAGLWNAT